MRAITRIIAVSIFCFTPFTAFAEEEVDLEIVNRIFDQGINHSEVMDTLQHLTDVIGPRLTGSPQMKQSNDWTRDKFAEWGLENAHLEDFEFGRGWTFSKSVVRMTSPRVAQLYALPMGWTPGTDGVVSGEVIHVTIDDEEDFEDYRGKLSGKIVLLDKARERREPSNNIFTRRDEKSLANTKEYDIPNARGSGGFGNFKKLFAFTQDLYKFLKEEGAVAAIKISPREAALIEASFYIYEVGKTVEIPVLSMTSEDYDRTMRLLDLDNTVTLELEVEAQYYDDDTKGYNTIAEIPGQGRNPEIVMAGAHLDSWFVGDGAVDNGAGSAVVMEAARILSAIGIKPKRTIRFGLWSGEEQGFYGSLDYVTRHFAERPLSEKEEDQGLPRFFSFTSQWPIQPKPAHEKLSVYFNLDNGSGKIRGIYGEGNPALQPIFKSWLKPFHDLGAETVVLGNTGGTDHQPFQWIGLPGFQFIQDPLDYGSRLHHSQIDTLSHVYEKDLQQAAIIMASFLYHAAMRDERMPRMPLPTDLDPDNGDDE